MAIISVYPLCLIPQCSRQPRTSAGSPRMARQLWTLSKLVPQTRGGVWGEVLLFVSVLLPLCSDLPLDPQEGLVCEQVSRGRAEGRAWLFMGQCWLAVDKGDGRVERMLQVCTEGIGFAKVELSLTPVYTKKNPSSFTFFYHVTLALHLCACRCCDSSCVTIWLTTTFGYPCTAAPALTRSHTLKDLAWACCYSWGTLQSTQPSYHRWIIR